jgi:hypothetical protein
MADGSSEPIQVQPPPSPRRYWTRRGLAEWLREELDRDIPTLVGIDHAFSFPLAYFEKYRLSSDWSGFLLDFQKHRPTDENNTFIDLIRDGDVGDGKNRMGENTWLRLAERWTATAKSVFLFDVQGSVAKSTFAGLPWLLYLRSRCKRPSHFWPFDGWEIPEGTPVVAEVYPALWMRRLERDDRDADEHAAYATAAWFQRADENGCLGSFLKPVLTPDELEVARIEGWILGVV